MSKRSKDKTADQRTIPAPVRSTSGAGFDFEDHVGAWLILTMLSGQDIPGIEGVGQKLQMQVASLGWLLDDLLVTAEDSDSRTRRLAISAKGNVQVSAAGVPSDFLTRAWHHWNDRQGPFNRKQDQLALVTRGRSLDFDPTWVEIRNACLGSDAKLAHARIENNRAQKRIFENIRLAADSGAGTTPEDAIEFIKHINVIPFDFQLENSESVRTAIALCQQLLDDKSASEAKRFWNRLIELTKEVRLKAGSINVDDVWSVLRREFSLQDRPDYSAAWKDLGSMTERYLQSIEAQLPGGQSIPRRSLEAALYQALQSRDLIVLFGESGAGKSALAKHLLHLHERWRQVWLGPAQLSLILSTPSYRHAISTVLSSSAAPENVLVLDAAERITPELFGAVKEILAKLLGASDSPAWRVLIIAQTQGWANISGPLLGQRRRTNIEIPRLGIPEVQEALDGIAPLRWLRGHVGTVGALTNLKVLAWVTSAPSILDGTTAELISHTEVADRLWDFWTNHDLTLAVATMELAKREAGFERSFPLGSIDHSFLPALNKRPAHLPLRLNELNHFEFEHDLAADWARFQYLKQVSTDVSDWAPLASNPLWANALRMLSQWLLRRETGGRFAWDDAYATAEASHPLAADILLDGLCLDPAAETHLSARIDLLLENHGQRLGRLLTRFLHIATLPSPSSVLAELDPSTALYLEAAQRSIVPMLWAPMLSFITTHAARVGRLIVEPLSRLCEMWLSQTPWTMPHDQKTPFRHELAEIALAVAREVQAKKASDIHFIKMRSELFSAALAAAPDLPEKVSEWALEMAGKREPSEYVRNCAEREASRRQEEHRVRLKSDPNYRAWYRERRSFPPEIGGIDRTPLPPWPLGPKYDVDQDFRRIGLNENALVALMKVRPDIGREVILALLIEEHPYEEYGNSRLRDDLGLSAEHVYPTVFWKGPFLRFLHVSPQAAITTIVDLVNFCTDRWAAPIKAAGHTPL